MKQTIQIRSERNVANAVTTAATIATSIGFDQTRVSAISTAVSEIARNIVKYADFGQVTIESMNEAEPGIEITARDHGPGITDIEAALTDHYSTTGTLGLGLPGVRRLMDELTVESTPGSGTTVKTRLRLRDSTRRPSSKHPSAFLPAAQRPTLRDRRTVLGARADSETAEVLAGSFVRPHHGEMVSGDLVVLRWIGAQALLVVLDALGHGASAARIATNAATAIATITEPNVLATIDTLDDALRGSDGAAAAIAVADPRDRSIDTASVGNVRIRVLGPSGVRIPWTEGTLGQQFRRPIVQHRTLGHETLVMYSDGVTDRFDDKDYPAAIIDSPDLAAKTIVERFGKDYDDSSCAVMRFAR